MSNRDYLRNKVQAMPKKIDGVVICIGPTISNFNNVVNTHQFNTASSYISRSKNCPINRGDMGRETEFIDNTIRLNSGLASGYDNCNVKTLTRPYVFKRDGPKAIVCFYRPSTDFSRNATKPWVGDYNVLPSNIGSFKTGGAVPSHVNRSIQNRGNPRIGHPVFYAGPQPSFGNYFALKINRPTLFNIKG
jgi:hypothetical protein